MGAGTPPHAHPPPLPVPDRTKTAAGRDFPREGAHLPCVHLERGGVCGELVCRVPLEHLHQLGCLAQGVLGGYELGAVGVQVHLPARSHAGAAVSG